MIDHDPLQLEPAGQAALPAADPRPKMPEPLPVNLVSVADVTLPAVAGLQERMDALYIGLLQFAKDESQPPGMLIYRADNFRLIFRLHEIPVIRDHYPVTQIVVQSLAAAEQKLIDAEIEHTRQRGLLPGMESLVLNDPAGNFLELIESRCLF